MYLVADSVVAYLALLDSDFCMAENSAAILLHRTIYKLYCCVGLGPLIVDSYTHWTLLFSISDQFTHCEGLHSSS